MSIVDVSKEENNYLPFGDTALTPLGTILALEEAECREIEEKIYITRLQLETHEKQQLSVV